MCAQRCHTSKAPTDRHPSPPPPAAALAASLAARGFGPAGRGRGREGPSPLSTGRGDGGGRGRGAAAAAKEAAQDGGSVLLAAASAHEGPITVTATAVPAMVPGMSLGQDIRCVRGSGVTLRLQGWPAHGFGCGRLRGGGAPPSCILRCCCSAAAACLTVCLLLAFVTTPPVPLKRRPCVQGVTRSSQTNDYDRNSNAPRCLRSLPILCVQGGVRPSQTK